jgi:MYXO-CTERM domain-containing protein
MTSLAHPRLTATLALTTLTSLALVATPRPAAACSPWYAEPLVLDPAYATDAVAPGPVTATAEVSRSDEPDGCTIDTCGSGATIALAVSATDDRAPTERLGYRVAIVGGDVPEGFWVDAAAIQANGWLYYSFNDDRAFSFQVEVRAVDLNGNAGPPTLVTIAAPGADDGGCSSAGAGRPAGFGLLALAGLAAVRRRASRRASASDDRDILVRS